MSEQGSRALSTEELLAILLGSGCVGMPVGVLAARVLAETGGLLGIERAGLGELTDIQGIGHSKASRLLAAVELGRRVATTPLPRGSEIHSSRDVDAAMRPWLSRANQEHFVAIAVDARHRVLGQSVVGVGGLAVCPVSPADLFRLLLRQACTAAILVHNHPSGDPSPSDEDAALTRRLHRAGQLLDIAILDHVIIGSDDYFSFYDEGLLREKD